MAGRHSEFRSHEDSDEEIQIVGEERLKKYQKGTRNAFKTFKGSIHGLEALELFTSILFKLSDIALAKIST